jgi:hypothetical protein
MQTTERELRALPGGVMVLVELVELVVSLAAIGLLYAGLRDAVTDGGDPDVGLIVAAVVLAGLAALAAPGFTVVQPNESRVAFFGRYLGTLRQDGFWWVNPLTVRRRVSLRIQNLDSDVLKVNDAVGNPVEIAAVIQWQIVDTARAVFDVEDYDTFVQIQAETAVRHVASEFPYDDYEEGQASLRGNAEEVMATLQNELQERLDVAGVRVLDTRLRRLAYAPEIAGEMLRRQQANAVVAARQRIVEGAVGMVDMALRSLSEQGIVELDEERKAAMVSNLMVVLVSERGAQPVVNSGSLYT